MRPQTSPSEPPPLVDSDSMVVLSAETHAKSGRKLRRWARHSSQPLNMKAGGPLEGFVQILGAEWRNSGVSVGSRFNPACNCSRMQ